jgi:CPA1 family monovalent cation:H+ antiporter
MHTVDVLLLGLVAVAALATLAKRLGVPYPILLLLGGVALAPLPGLPRVTADPDLVFALFVPPLVFSAAWQTSWRDLRNNVWPIALLAVGLVLATMTVVAVVAHVAVPGMTWPVAFVLGAVVSPTDTVAVNAIASRLGLPRRLVTILEGESNLNDAVSLVAYRAAVAAVVTGSFSLPRAAAEVGIDGIGGVAIGLGVAWLYQQVERRIDAPEVEVTLTLLLPYAAFIPAERFGFSGVIAVVTAGILGSGFEGSGT